MKFLFCIEDDPGDPSQFNAYPAEPTYGTFTDLRALIDNTTGVLDLNGSTFEAETSDLDPMIVDYGGPIVGSSITTMKNGTIIGGRVGSWTEVETGIYRAPLTDDEFSVLDPRCHLYDSNASEIPSMALYPVGPSAMLPRNSMSYNTNWWYITKIRRVPTWNRGLFTHGRILKIEPVSGSFPTGDALENLFHVGGEDSSMVYSDGSNETNALSKLLLVNGFLAQNIFIFVNFNLEILVLTDL